MKVLVAINESKHSHNAMLHAVKLCKNLKKYSLLFMNIISLNPKPKTPFMDHLEEGINLQLKEDADNLYVQLNEMMRREAQGVEFEFLQIEGEGSPGQVLEKYLKENSIQLDLIVMGSSHKGQFEKYYFH